MLPISKYSRKAVFLDRDGVINHAIVKDGKPYPPQNVAAVTIPSDASSALTQLSEAGFLLIVITNQPDVARGLVSRDSVEEINHFLASCLPIDDTYTCFHDNHDLCLCRKPKPGSLLTAAQTHQIDLQQSYMIGDRWVDMEAGQQAGCKTIFIDHGYAEQLPTKMDFCVKTLTQATQLILGETI